MNYYPFHIGDYVSATRHLSWEEDAAYRRLLDTYYTTESPLPAEHRAVCRLVMATTEVQREAVATVLEEFFELTDAGWVNHRADGEINAMREKQQKQRDKANKRWHKPQQEPCNAPAMPQHESAYAVASISDANAMPPTPTPTPTPTPREKIQASLRLADLVALEIPEQIAKDFMATRKAKKSPLTQTALDGIAREAKLAGIDLSAAITICTERGWSGFKAEWLNQRTQPMSRADHVKAHNQALLASVGRSDVIEGEVIHATR